MTTQSYLLIGYVQCASSNCHWVLISYPLVKLYVVIKLFLVLMNNCQVKRMTVSQINHTVSKPYDSAML